jgi:hypothetical protein
MDNMTAATNATQFRMERPNDVGDFGQGVITREIVFISGDLAGGRGRGMASARRTETAGWCFATLRRYQVI